MIERQLAALSVLGQIEARMHALTGMAQRLRHVPLWLPAHALAKQADEALALVAGMQSRLEGSPVVTLIGPSGAGKSTLLNALAGIDELSPAGGRRPTTRGLVVLAQDGEAVRRVFGTYSEDQVQIRSPRNPAGPAAMLIDTPDTDSTQNKDHWPLIVQAVTHSDMLICLFDAQNPKRRDHADFMAPLVRQFHGASLVAVLNHADRLNASELTDVIVPEFRDYLQQAWDVQPQVLLVVSARRHLQDPRWEAQAAPRHELDQFEQLRRLVFETMSGPGYGQDRRLANAGQIVHFMQNQIRQAVEQDQPFLREAAQRIAAVEQLALRKAVESLRADDRRMILGVNVRLYQALAQRWVGPVGWMVAIWSRLILFGTGVAALLRFGNPVQQIWGLLASWRRYKESSAAVETLSDQNRVDSALQAFQQVWWMHWPEISETLIQAHFDPQVRRVEVQEGSSVGRLARTWWGETLDAEIERSARHLSHWLLQLFFNLPALVLLGYVAWLTATRFLTGTYLSGDFFLHALLTIAVILLLSFFAFQVCARTAVSRERIQKRAFQAVERAIGHHPMLAGGEIAEQVRQVLALTDSTGGKGYQGQQVQMD